MNHFLSHFPSNRVNSVEARITLFLARTHARDRISNTKVCIVLYVGHAYTLVRVEQAEAHIATYAACTRAYHRKTTIIYFIKNYKNGKFKILTGITVKTLEESDHKWNIMKPTIGDYKTSNKSQKLKERWNKRWWSTLELNWRTTRDQIFTLSSSCVWSTNGVRYDTNFLKINLWFGPSLRVSTMKDLIRVFSNMKITE